MTTLTKQAYSDKVITILKFAIIAGTAIVAVAGSHFTLKGEVNTLNIQYESLSKFIEVKADRQRVNDSLSAQQEKNEQLLEQLIKQGNQIRDNQVEVARNTQRIESQKDILGEILKEIRAIRSAGILGK